VMLVDRGDVWSESDILLKVRAPSMEEIDVLRRGGTIISFLYPAQNRNIVEKIASREATSFAMDMIPRISRAQVFDALRCVSFKHCISHIVIITILQFDGQHRWVQSGGRSLQSLWAIFDWTSNCSRVRGSLIIFFSCSFFC
jgi:NAD/NADP transhydrogenase alpha subunit